MPIIGKPVEILKNQDNVFTLDKTALGNESKVTNDAYFTVQSNWKKVIVAYLTDTGSQVEFVTFDATLGSPTSNFRVSDKARDLWQVDALIIQDFDGGYLRFERDELTTADFDVDFNAVAPPPTLSYFEDNFSTGDFTAGSYSDWSIANDSNNYFIVNNATSQEGGFSAYITTSSGTPSYEYQNGPTNSHIYQDITIPAEAVNPILEIDYRCLGEINYDYGAVCYGDIASMPVPVGGTFYTNGSFNILLVGGSTNSDVYRRFEADVSSFIGQTIRVVISYHVDTTTTLQPPLSVDSVVVKDDTGLRLSQLVGSSLDTSGTAPATGIWQTFAFDNTYNITKVKIKARFTGALSSTYGDMFMFIESSDGITAYGTSEPVDSKILTINTVGGQNWITFEFNSPVTLPSSGTYRFNLDISSVDLAGPAGIAVLHSPSNLYADGRFYGNSV